jgi:hypothetical protein
MPPIILFHLPSCHYPIPVHNDPGGLCQRHVQALLGMLYGSTPPADTPVSSIKPPRSQRKKDIFQRYQSGESPSLLAREYEIQ